MNTAQIMERQTIRNAPNVDMSQTFAQMGAQGYVNDKTDLDGGKTWRRQFTAVDGTYLNSTDFVNGNEGWAVGWTVKNQNREGLVLHTTDGGDKWAQVSTNLKERFFDRVFFYDQHHGWLIARDDIFYTDDRGQTFRLVLKLSPIKNGSE